MRIYDQLCESKDLPTKMESISKSRLLSLLCGKSFDWFQIEVVIQMKIVKVLSVNQQVQHVVALATNLKPHFHPVKSSCLKELGSLERSEQISETRKYQKIVSCNGRRGGLMVIALAFTGHPCKNHKDLLTRLTSVLLCQTQRHCKYKATINLPFLLCFWCSVFQCIKNIAL